MRFGPKHKHRYITVRSIMKASIGTGVPVTVAHVERCKCGREWREVTPAGSQQLGWGAEYESLFDEGPIRVDPDWRSPRMLPIEQTSLWGGRSR